MPGILVLKNNALVIPKGGFQISLYGESTIQVHIEYDVCPTWLEISAKHLNEAKTYYNKAINIDSFKDKRKAENIEFSFRASMQAIIATTIAFDALYSNLRARMILPVELLTSWKKNGTARYATVSEIIRRALNLGNDCSQSLREQLKEFYRFRDAAVHPRGTSTPPVLFAEIDALVEQRYVEFRYDNAHQAVKAATQIVHDLANKGKPANRELDHYIASLSPRIELLRKDCGLFEEPAT
ncbi:hypothetical protein [Rhodoplanes azumiensis]|uniref:Apea-like HEPN domain-containing protein n=1 Tax=Rhodoplanes azumiensis TaxID=1897628 RepID=A0ABW5AKY6_9BRAD